MSSTIEVDETVRIRRPQLQDLIDYLVQQNYRTVGPQVSQGGIVYDDLHSVEQLPIGILDEQDGGIYHLKEEGDAWFGYTVGPHSLKNLLFPPRETLVQLDLQDGRWQSSVPTPGQPIAVIGPRSCDLHAMAIQDRVFLESGYVDPAYQQRRKNLFIVAVNCHRAVATCFCHSMQSGPVCQSGYDLVIDEVEDEFLLTIGSEQGREIVAALNWEPCSEEQISKKEQLQTELASKLNKRSQPSEDQNHSGPRERTLDTSNLHDLLMDNLESPRWDQIAERCLACTNCTLVCPTCFCSGVEEVSDLSGTHVERERTWDSCFTSEHSEMNSGPVRKTIAARYRQWMTHKLATWIDQFGESGCVGCGRCITWCPVGIDLTEEVAALRESTQ